MNQPQSQTRLTQECLPGSDPLPSILLEKLEQVHHQLGSDYRPRTRHLTETGTARFTNRLFLETSPYLQQHAHNPVNWYPWGDEAFKQAKTSNRPVLVSIGYSTCHWCHVMEEESFEDLEIAEFLNRHYICIKVDREERPDVDAIYMKAIQAMTGSGGWPLNVMVSPDKDPFWGGTYFPPRDGDRGASYGFLTILRRLSKIYLTTPVEIERACRELSGAIERFAIPTPGKNRPGVELLDSAVKMYKAAFDPVNGGIQGAPKFPASLPVRFLLRSFKRTGDKQILDIVKLSLEKMASGGMYDHVAGGFHRYATDSSWLVPHFEKMLYDNALLVPAYLEAYQVTGESYFKEIVTDILDYVLKEMTSAEGAFYSATDADSLTQEGLSEEGYFFTWTEGELQEVLDQKQLQWVREVWGVTASGNFEGRNILFQKEIPASIAKKLGQTRVDFQQHRAAIRKILYQKRESRVHPLRDEKIIVSWNGLMISAFAQAGAILGKLRYLEAASKAAQFINDNLIINGRLYRSFKNGEVKHKAFLSDYSNYLASCLDLFQATSKPDWLDRAIELDRFLATYYEDRDHGGFFMTGTDQEVVLLREKPESDSALPSGNAIAMINLLRLQALTLKDAYRVRFEKALSCFLGRENQNSSGKAEMLSALEFALAKPLEIVIVTAADPTEAKPYLDVVKKYFLPTAQIIVSSNQNPDNRLHRLVPFITDHRPVDGKTTVYLCTQGTCQAPFTDPHLLENHLRGLN